MHSQPGRSDASRQRAEGQFKSKKKADAQTPRAADTLRQTEAEKTARLRALRLAKEAADRENPPEPAVKSKAKTKAAKRG